jgi:hypothetical protein
VWRDAGRGIGRLLTWTVAAGAANNFLQAAFVELTREREEVEEPV